uniref:Adenylate kinase active site lid domain-containing protein n=1 Tax=Megaselia scalaris TaxID=36166 RepID=T1H4H6_MEGSC
MSSKLFKAIILGAPASGKGTISKRILDKYGFKHIASGDILRMNIANNTELGVAAKKYIDEGKLVPNDLIIKCIMTRIDECNSSSWLLDGFPRTFEQAKQLHSVHKVNAVINLNVPFEVIVDRVKGRWIHLPSGRVYNIGFNEPKVPGKDDETGDELVQRPDDQPDVVRKRLEVYQDTINPVIEFYEKLGLVQGQDCS